MICSKQTFTSYSDAGRAAKHTRERGYGHGMKAYRCERCRFWHIGHTPNLVKKFSTKFPRK